jgi:hypothetical protein
MAGTGVQAAAEGIGTLWACSCRMLREEPLARSRCLPSGAPSKLPLPYTRVPETPPDLPLDCHTRAGFSLGNQPA